MATNNAINTNKPIEVASGGTGAATLTDHGVLVGSGTSAIDAIAVGGLGQLLVGATGADPAFASSADGDFSFTASTVTNRTLSVINTNNSSSSAATLTMTVGGSSAGDPASTFTVSGTTNWSMGIDNSATVPSIDPFVISASTTLGTNDVMRVASTGEMVLPLQSAFLGVLGTTDADATGDSTSFTIGTGNAFTEIFDQNNDFNTNGTFTAPVAGRYFFHGACLIGDLTASFNAARMTVSTTGATYFGNHFNPGAVQDVNNQCGLQISTFANMAAGDTAVLSIAVNGSTKTVDVIGGTPSTDSVTYFCGYLAC